MINVPIHPMDMRITLTSTMDKEKGFTDTLRSLSFKFIDAKNEILYALPAVLSDHEY